MLKNLIAEMAWNGVTAKDIAKKNGICDKSAQNKVKGKTDFTFPEALTTRDELFPSKTLEYLFKDEL